MKNYQLIKLFVEIRETRCNHCDTFHRLHYIGGLFFWLRGHKVTKLARWTKWCRDVVQNYIRAIATTQSLKKITRPRDLRHIIICHLSSRHAVVVAPPTRRWHMWFFYYYFFFFLLWLHLCLQWFVLLCFCNKIFFGFVFRDLGWNWEFDEGVNVADLIGVDLRKKFVIQNHFKQIFCNWYWN